MKETILGIDQAQALRYGLTVVDLLLLDVVRQKSNEERTSKKTAGGKEYVWISYSAVLEWLPILGVNKRGVAKYLDRLEEKGLIEKLFLRKGGCYTFFRLSDKGLGVFVGDCSFEDKGLSPEEQRVCSEKDKGFVPNATNKKDTEIKDTEIKKKEINNNKLLFTKKEDGDTFETTFERFMANAIDDGNFRYSLRGYRIKDYTALLVAFRKHVANQCKQGEFIDNGYVRNRTWLLRSMPYLDLGEATGYTLGHGEYLKDNRRWYRNRAGKEIEVPMDAPPRRQGTIWYQEQGRWGPDI